MGWGWAERLATTCAGVWNLAQSLGPLHPQPDWQKVHKMALHTHMTHERGPHRFTTLVVHWLPRKGPHTGSCSGLNVPQPSRRHWLNDWMTKHEKGSNCTNQQVTNAWMDEELKSAAHLSGHQTWLLPVKWKAVMTWNDAIHPAVLIRCLPAAALVEAKAESL